MNEIINKILLSSLSIIYPFVTNDSDPPDNHNYPVTAGIFSPHPQGLFQQAEIKDYGDAPISYGSADHIIDSLNFLGSIVDYELVYQQSSAADADDRTGVDDEDGVQFPELRRGTRVVIPIKVVGNAHLNIWIDWNGDGDFNDKDERIITDALKSTGTFNLSVRVPENAIVSKPTFARFRFGPKSTTKPVYGSSGSAKFGEVEDYMITILCAPLAAPKIGMITQPTCELTTGSVKLDGLPGTGTWTLTRSPGGVTTTGTGTSTVISGLAPGIYNYTVTNAEGCTSSPSANIIIFVHPAAPTPPVPGIIIQPSCTVSTGNVVLDDLPDAGIWTLIRSPDGVITTGTGTTTTISGLVAGTYFYTVTNSDGCTSVESAAVIINAQPEIPATPTIGTITSPTCTSSTGSVILNGLPATGNWVLTRYPGTIKLVGAGTSKTIPGLSAGTYNYTVTNSSGCQSTLSANVVIPSQPNVPSAPVPGNITQPTYKVPTGSVVLAGLPSVGTWTVTRIPGEITTTGTGTSKIISALPAGVFTFTVTNSAGCTSTESNEVIISLPGIPTLIITDPAPVCAPTTVDLTASAVTAGSTPGLTYTYWTDVDATLSYSTPTAANNGIYYIKGTTVSGYFDVKPVVVTVDQMPVPNAGPDQTLNYVFTTTLDADDPGNNLTGSWSLISGSGQLSDANDAKSTITNLAIGINVLSWIVTNGVCQALDFVAINVTDLVIPTLITPDMDGKNDYFILRGLETLGKTELTIFDRRGVRVYINENYKNEWNGIGYNSNPLPNDTYFYVLRSESGKSLNGFIVIRR